MDIRRLVKQLVGHHKTRDPFRLCVYLGVHVLWVPLIELRGFFIQEDGVSMMFVADDLPDWEADFVCAHELGHFLLHKGLNRMFMDARTSMVVNKYEKRADMFACQLLYSEPPMYQEQALSEWQLAGCLGVPSAQVNARLLELDVCF